MDFNFALSKITQVRVGLYATHQQALSNGLSPEDVSKAFKKIDKTLNNLENNIYTHEVVGYNKKEHNYELPKRIHQDKNVSVSSLGKDVKISHDILDRLSRDLNGINYKLVNKTNNKFEYMNSKTKKALTGSVNDIKKILSLFKTEEEPAKEEE